jgi:hypothetical protein
MCCLSLRVGKNKLPIIMSTKSAAGFVFCRRGLRHFMILITLIDFLVQGLQFILL